MTVDVQTGETAKKQKSSLATRLKSAAIFAPVVFLLVYIGGGGFALMMTAAGGIAIFEWVRMMLNGKDAAPKMLPVLSGVVCGFGIIAAAMVNTPVGAFLFLVALCFMIFAYNYAQNGPSLFRVIFPGILYIGLSFQTMIWLRDGTSVQGLFHFVTLLCLVWGSDSFAYFAGRTIGGPKLAPEISPNKTIAGLAGACVGTGFLAALLAKVPAMLPSYEIVTLGGLHVTGYYVMGFILAACGQAGDLLVSYFKRRSGVKDTGALIPGHGGILDRVDALLLVGLIFGGLVCVLG